MTVSTSTNSVVYRGNGATTQFAVPFRVLDVNHLVVTRRNFITGETLYTYVGTDFSYIGIGADAGTLTLAGTALDDDFELVIERIVPYTQGLDIVNSGGFYPETVEEELDLIVMGVQQLADLSKRGVTVPVGESGIKLSKAADRAGKFFGFDAGGNFTPLSGTGSDSALRTDLAGTLGASLIGMDDGDTVQETIGDLRLISAEAAGLAFPTALTRLSTSVFMLCDSFGSATGASTYQNGYSYLFMRSLLNSLDQGHADNSGFGYHTIISMADAVSEASAALGGGTGVYVATGIANSRLQLGVGAYIQITGREVSALDVIYDGSASVGASFEFRLNGVLITTKAVAGAGLRTTFQTLLKGGVLTRATDVIRITVIGASAVILGLQPYRNTVNVPICYVSAHGGTAIQDYIDAPSLDEIAYYLNLFRVASPKMMMWSVFLNCIYSAGKAITPTAMIAALTTGIAGINSRCTQVTHTILTPVRAADEGVWPVRTLGYTHADYVDALTAFAAANSYKVIRQDLVDLIGQTADGIHANDSGYAAMAAYDTAALNIPFNPCPSKPPAHDPLRGTFAYNPPNLVAGTGDTQTFAIVGVRSNDYVQVSFSNSLQGLSLTGYFHANDTVGFRLQNGTAGAVDLAAGTITAIVYQD